MMIRAEGAFEIESQLIVWQNFAQSIYSLKSQFNYYYCSDYYCFDYYCFDHYCSDYNYYN